MKTVPRARGRRRPTQRRSQVTVTAILDAAARVFEERGFEAGTTNHVAERAGVSIGSLYEYFPNKDAMVVALVERELERERAKLLAILAPAGTQEDLAAQLRSFVETLVELHAKRPSLHRILFDQAEHPPAAHACVLRFEESLAHALADSLHGVQPSLRDADTRAHLIVQTTESLAHRFVLARDPRPGSRRASSGR